MSHEVVVEAGDSEPGCDCDCVTMTWVCFESDPDLDLLHSHPTSDQPTHRRLSSYHPNLRSPLTHSHSHRFFLLSTELTYNARPPLSSFPYPVPPSACLRHSADTVTHLYHQLLLPPPTHQHISLTSSCNGRRHSTRQHLFLSYPPRELGRLCVPLAGFVRND